MTWHYFKAHQADVRTLLDFTKDPEQKLLLSLHLNRTFDNPKEKYILLNDEGIYIYI